MKKQEIKVMRSVLSKEDCRKMREKFDRVVEEGGARLTNCDVKKFDVVDINEIFEDEQEQLTFHAAEACGKVLLPSYNLARKYWKGSLLRRHTDRDACEYSMTLNFATHEKPWTFYCEVDGREIGVDLSPGDGLYYTGMTVPHWREKLETDYCYQVFFHWVDKYGPCIDYAWEGKMRPFKPRQTAGTYKEPFDELE